MFSSDIFSSKSSITILGVLIAVSVVVCLGVLSMLALDPQFQGGEKTIQREIQEYSAEIDHFKNSIASANAALSLQKRREGKAKELVELNQKLEQEKQNNQSIRDRIISVEQAAIEQKNQTIAHRDQLRNLSKNKSIRFIKTREGATYHEVIIREVNAVGMQIRHSDGLTRVPFESLSEDLQERFLYDAKEKEDALLREAKAAEEIKEQARKRQAQAVEENVRNHQEAAATLKRSNLEIAKRQLASKEAEILNLKEAIRTERNKSVGRAPILEATLNKKLEELSTLRSQLRQIQATP